MLRGKLIERNIIGIINIERSQYIFQLIALENIIYLAYLIWRIVTSFDYVVLVQICLYVAEKLVKMVLNFQYYHSLFIKRLLKIIVSFISDVDILTLSISLKKEKTDMFSKFLSQNDPQAIYIEKDTTMSRIIFSKTIHMIVKLYIIFYSFYYLDVTAWVAIALCCYLVVLIGMIHRINLMIHYSLIIQKPLFKIYMIFNSILKLGSRLFSNFTMNQFILQSILYYVFHVIIIVLSILVKLNRRFKKLQHKNQMAMYPKRQVSVHNKNGSFILEIVRQAIYNAFISMNEDAVFFQISQNRKLMKRYYSPFHLFRVIAFLIINSWVLAQSYLCYKSDSTSKTLLTVFIILCFSLFYDVIHFVLILRLFIHNYKKYKIASQLVTANTKLNMTSSNQFQKLKFEIYRDMDPMLEKFVIGSIKGSENQFFVNNENFLSTIPLNKNQCFVIKKDHRFKICVQDQHLQMTLRRFIPKAIDIFLSRDEYLSIDVRENITDMQERRNTICKFFSYLIFMNPSIMVSEMKSLLSRLNSEEMESLIIEYIISSYPLKLYITGFCKHLSPLVLNNPHAVLYDLYDTD